MAYNVSMISDNQAEAGVIATLVYHPEYILHSDYLKPNHFFNVENGCIYWAISELYKKGVENIDAFNITNVLNGNRAVKKQMADHNLEDMQEFISMASLAARHSLEEYKLLVDNVITMAYKRDMNKVALELQSTCFDPNMSVSQINSIVNNRVNHLSEQYLTSQDIEMFGSKVDTLWQEVLERRTADGIYGIPSKYSILNDYFTYEKGELVVINGRMKAGKSAFMLNEAIDKIKRGIPTLYIDTEMQDRLFYERMLANLTGITTREIKMGTYSKEEAKILDATNDWIKKQPFAHIYLTHPTEDEIFAIHKILKYRMGLEFSVYDYIKGNAGDTGATSNYLGDKTDFLKNQIAGELNLAVLAGAQLNRQGAVADSDKIERNCSTSIYWRLKTADEIEEDGEDNGNCYLNVAKNRNGMQMDEDEYISFQFDGNTMSIEQMQFHPKLETPFDEVNS